ncbi:MAG TPA: glycerophosphoryl diester phosphodiesterase membrane domain-containing protein [Candidatus Ruania gallistercoris]|uniref:Glycerophosphoryl diester phosphodiesterase membrane domain-containing protein n=1 Tax=Candidatus Ruania gallistercoris TaxID=2838746 RepID=A0A9D2EF37_9MICO|nr:glycerophosphoryl diester phosphodiesterase membrane domain-containing protein [Candidatus Ruania gallistercoris]
MGAVTTGGTVALTWGAARRAATMLRTRWFAVLVAMVCVQGGLVWTMPLLVALVGATLRRLDIGGVNLETLDTVLTSPLAILALLLVAAVATILVLTEVTVFAVIGHLTLAGERVTFTSVLRRCRTTARKVVSWQGLVLVPYLTVLLPISEVGFTSFLTEYVAIPKFITGELLKTTPGTVLYVVVMGTVVYAMLRFLLFPAIVSGTEDTIVAALGRSLRMTRWRTLLGFGVVMLATALLAWLVLVLVGGLGAAPVAWVATPAAAGVMLGLVELAQFLVAGAAAAFLAFFFVAYLRAEQQRPIEEPSNGASARGTRVACASLLALAVLSATPQVVTASQNATAAAQTAPQIIGHRGYPARAVENSIAGLHAADAAGADMVEMDIQETRDGGLVVLHDVHLGRLTGVDRNVHELTEDEATALTVRQDGRTAPVPTLAEFVREADARGVRLLVELKPHGQERPEFAHRIVATLARLDPDRSHMIQSLDRNLIEEIARLDPERATAYVVGFQIGNLPATSSDAVVLEDWSVQDRMLVQARRQGRELYTWTVNEAGPLSDHIARGVDGVITDEVDRAVDVRERVTADPLTFYLERARGLVTV